MVAPKSQSVLHSLINNREPIHTGRGTPRSRRMQIMEHTVVSGSVHIAGKQHQRVCTQIFVQICFRVLCEWGRGWEDSYVVYLGKILWNSRHQTVRSLSIGVSVQKLNLLHHLILKMTNSDKIPQKRAISSFQEDEPSFCSWLRFSFCFSPIQTFGCNITQRCRIWAPVFVYTCACVVRKLQNNSFKTIPFAAVAVKPLSYFSWMAPR